MTTPRLDLDGLVVGRQAELARLALDLELAGRRGGDCVLVSGVPGVGKSTLVQVFGIDVSSRGGVFGYGRYLEGASSPYSALGEALGALVRGMESTGSGERDAWRADLHRAMSARTAGALAAVVPGLDAVFGTPPSARADEVADGRHRLWRVAARMVGITASYRPVVLAIDDLQWADQDSLLLLCELLSTSIRNLLVVGAHRAGEFDPTLVTGSTTNVDRLDLRSLPVEQVESLLAQVCGGGTELREVAAEFYRRTGGNPLEIRQLLHQAQYAGALTQVGHSASAVWDLHMLASSEAGSAPPEVVGQAVGRLSSADRAVLGALACVGVEFSLADAGVAAGRSTDVVGKLLWDALDLRLLDVVDAGGRKIAAVIDRHVWYRFSHDRVAEAARAAMSEDARREVHLRIGRHLVELGDGRLFEAARHLGIGGLALPEGAERASFAEVAHRAAELARRQSSCPLALACCRASLALLGPSRWLVHPGLTRTTQLAAAEAALLVSDFPLLESLLAEAEQELHDSADRAHLAFLRLKGQVAQHRLQDALATGLRALDELGQVIPPAPGKPRLLAAILRMKLTMRRWSNERLLGLPRCEDRSTHKAQLILEELRSIAYLARPELFPLIVAKQIELTLTRGLAPTAPIAISSYGVLLAVLGDYAGSQRFGEVALALTERTEFRDARPQTQFQIIHFIRHWRHPMHEGLPELLESFHTALDNDDVEYAGFLAAVLIYQSFWAGRPLAEIDALAQAIIPEIRSQPVPSMLCRSTQQYCLNLMGRTDDPFLLAGESGYDERDVLPIARRENDVVALSAAAITKFGLHFWQGDVTGGIPHADELRLYLDGMRGTSNMQLYHLVNALSRIEVAPGTRSTARAVNRAMALHRKWAAVAPANYAAPYELLSGVWARARGDLVRAERHLDRSIALAEEHQLPLIGGLGHEEAGALYAQTGRLSLSRVMVRAAHEKWLGLGLAARIEKLETTHPWLGTQDLVRAGARAVDPIAMHRLTQTLFGAATVEALAEALLGTVARTTGAARVVLFTGEGELLVPRAVREAGRVLMVDGTGAAVRYDASIVQAAARTGSLMVAAPDGASHESPGSHNAHATVAIAVPVRMRGQTIGAVYAEHDWPGQAHAPEHEDALVAMCAQAGAALWNLELESRLTRAGEERRSLVDAQSRFIPREILGILDIADISRVQRGHRVERRMTVLIADIRGYTALLEGMSVTEASELAMGFLGAVELPIITCNGLLQDVRGDEILAVFDGEPDDAVRAGLAMLRSLREHNRERVARGSDELRIGIGVNTGEVGLGLVGGVNRLALTVIGDAVNLASRVESATKRYGSNLLISERTYADLIDRAQFDIRRMERVLVVNRSQPVTIYEVFDEDPEPLRAAKRGAQSAFDEAFSLFDAGDAERAGAAFERCRKSVPGDQVAALHIAHCMAMAHGVVAPGPVALLDK